MLSSRAVLADSTKLLPVHGSRMDCSSASSWSPPRAYTQHERCSLPCLCSHGSRPVWQLQAGEGRCMFTPATPGSCQSARSRALQTGSPRTPCCLRRVQGRGAAWGTGSSGGLRGAPCRVVRMAGVGGAGDTCGVPHSSCWYAAWPPPGEGSTQALLNPENVNWGPEEFGGGAQSLVSMTLHAQMHACTPCILQAQLLLMWHHAAAPEAGQGGS
jgi:hypothetical protein